jgi:hypothetical protein
MSSRRNSVCRESNVIVADNALVKQADVQKIKLSITGKDSGF